MYKRQIFDGFNNDNFDLMALFNLSNPDILFDSAILSALISSCSFIYIAKDEDGEARMQVIDGANATGTIDPITGLLAEGYAVLKLSLIHIYFKEYVEMWIHEVKIPLASLMLINHNSNNENKKYTVQLNRIDNFLEQILYYVPSEYAEKDFIIKYTDLRCV